VTTTDQKERGEDQEPSFWPSFTRADTRLFIVTFAGTLAANVMTLVVVALAAWPDPS